jgi:hypothetical protein
MNLKAVFGWLFRVRDDDPTPALQAEELTLSVRNKTARQRALITAVTDHRYDPKTYDLARFLSELHREKQDG